MSENFSIIQAGHPWVNRDGTPTPYFFRLIVNMFEAGGGGKPPGTASIVNYTFSQNQSGGRDAERNVSDITTALSTYPNSTGRIAALEKRIVELEQIIYESRTVDVNPMQKQIDRLTALVMASH